MTKKEKFAGEVMNAVKKYYKEALLDGIKRGIKESAKRNKKNK